MRKIFFLLLFLASLQLHAQHCPWDCSGMIALNTKASAQVVYQLHPVLVDENKIPVIDTVYGTGLDTHDSCVFLYYDDFLSYRTQKISVHSFYQYDTFYHFAQGDFIVKYNFCKYEGQKLFLRFIDSASGQFQYLEIPDNKRMHLHNYSSLLFGRETDKMKKETRSLILSVDCRQWDLPEEKCGGK